MAYLPPLESDPILASVPENLSMGGGEIAAIVKSSAAPTGNEIMSILHLMASGQPHAAPVSTSVPAPSSAGPLVGGLAAGLAAGVAAGAMAFSGSKGAAKTGHPPTPPAEVPAAKAGKAAAPVTTTSTTTAATKDPVPPPGGGKVPEPPTKAPIDPKIYSGFEEAELGKGTAITLGGKYDAPKAPAPKPVPTPATPPFGFKFEF